MKKEFCIVIAALLVLSLTACGKSKSANSVPLVDCSDHGSAVEGGCYLMTEETPDEICEEAKVIFSENLAQWVSVFEGGAGEYALGQDNMAAIQKNASIAKANADRDVAIAQAQARKEANDAKVLSDTEIAVKQNELSIKKAELKTIEDTKNAEADAAYEIQKEAQRKTIEVTKTEADIARQEKEVDLKKKEAEVMEQSLDADIRKKAEADKFARQQQADAELYKRQRNAEADKFEKQQEAEAKKAQAEAELFAKQQEAAGIRAVGEAEAKAIEAKGLAEAEALEKKAEAMKKYGQAAMVEMIVKALPEMAKAIAEPLSTIDKVTIIDGNGEGSGVGSMGSYVPQVLAKTMESVKEVTGIDIADIMRANTYDAKVNKNVNITGLDGIKVEAPAEAGTSVDTTVE